MSLITSGSVGTIAQRGHGQSRAGIVPRPGTVVLGGTRRPRRRREIVRRLGPVVGGFRPELREGRPGAFEELRTQYEVERRV